MAEPLPHGEFREAALADIKARIAKADGNPIRLGKILPSGERVWIAVRPGTYEKILHDEDSDPTLPTVLVEALAQTDLIFSPIGHWDWYIDGDVAVGCINMHRVGNTNSSLAWRQASDAAWQENNNGLEVKVAYRGSGVGSLLVAASGVALQDRVKTISTGGISEQAKQLLRGFGFQGGLSFDCPVDQLASHPKVDSTLLRFL